MVLIRKSKAGADSFGNEWSEDGAVVDVDQDEARQLLAIADGGFSVADPDPEPELEAVVPEPPNAAPDSPEQPAEPEPTPAEEPEELVEAPAEPDQPVDEAPAPARRTPSNRTRKN